MIPSIADSASRHPAAPRRENGPGDPLPVIDVTEQDLARWNREAWDALQLANTTDPSVFRHGVPSRIERDDEGAPTIRILTESRMRNELVRVARWQRVNRHGNPIATMPPLALVRDVLATRDPDLPILNRIVETPVFAPDGSLSTIPGYSPAGRFYYFPGHGLTIPDVPDTPTAIEILRARRLITEDLIGDFPFTSDAEKANAVALLLLPFVRELIDGPTPLHLIESPSPGTGKTLLKEMLLYPAIGRATAAMTECRDEDEWRKRITAKLLSGPSAFPIDNLRRRLDSASLSSALTALSWEDRILGFSEKTTIPVRCAWVGTGNNPALSNEIARRTVRIRIDAKADQPWLRTGFRHADLRSWSKENRGELVWAALTLVSAWLAEEAPRGTVHIGMFEEWSAVLGGVLKVAEVPGFLTNLQDLYDSADDEIGQLRDLIEGWWGMWEGRPVSTKEIFEYAEKGGIELPLGEGNERSRQTRLGRLLARNRDRQFGERRLEKLGKSDGLQKWRLA